MDHTYRALPAWTHPDQPERPATFRVTYGQTLRELKAEVDAIGGSGLVIGLVARPGDLRVDGTAFTKGGRARDPGAEVSFDIPGRGRLVFRCRTHRVDRQVWRRPDEGGPFRVEAWQDNVRAIRLGLEALRAVDRYGIADAGEQFQGFLALPQGGSPVERGRKLVEEHGSVRAAQRATHPDTGGDVDDFRAVGAYAASLEGR